MKRAIACSHEASGGSPELCHIVICSQRAKVANYFSSQVSLMHVSGRLGIADGAVNAGKPSFGSTLGVGGRTPQGVVRCTWENVGESRLEGLSFSCLDRLSVLIRDVS